MLIGVIADDFTGATDVASFLAQEGLNTVQTIGIPVHDIPPNADAVVISLKSRSCPPQTAVKDSLNALRWLRSNDCPRIFQKYCSTFDSTASGNIGPVADALLESLNEAFTVICPALPINGRTVYFGRLFVDGVPLDESGMRHHPITPMLDDSLIRLMEAQAEGTCGLVSLPVIEQGEEAVRKELQTIRAQGHRYAVLDASDDRHLRILGSVVGEMPFVTGGSGLAWGMATKWRDQIDPLTRTSFSRHPARERSVVIAGSCSKMTNQQVAAYRDSAPSLAVEIQKCFEPERYAEELCTWVLGQENHSWAPMVYATTDPATLNSVLKEFGGEASAAIERTFAALVSKLAASDVTRYIVAGGETSGSVVQALGVDAFHIGPTISPGVPWVTAVGKPYSMALKSGNFGDTRFFFRCQETQ